MAAHVAALPRISIDLRILTLIHDPPPLVAQAWFGSLFCARRFVSVYGDVCAGRSYVIWAV